MKINKLIVFLLSPFSFLYKSILRLRNWMFDRGIIKTVSLPCKVVSVGNLTLGGTGKTPFSAFLAGELKKIGMKPCILSRGYKGKKSENVSIVSNGFKSFGDYREHGDEPVLLAEKLKKVPVVVGSSRFQCGIRALEEFNIDCFILDDGFQHRKLERELDIVLIDGQTLLGNEKMFPNGPLREPFKGIRRAGAIVVTRWNMVVDTAMVEEYLEKVAVKPVFHAESIICGYFDMKGKKVKIPIKSMLLGFCGIGNPYSFEKNIKLSGYSRYANLFFPDHHGYTQKDIDRILGMAEKVKADRLVTTEKDFIKVRELDWHGKEPLFMKIETVVLEEKEFLDFLKGKLS